MLFFTSDWHFNHDKEFVWKKRGFSSVDEMNEEIVRRHNEVVTENDIVYFLGDACLGGASEEILKKNCELIERLNGNIVMLRGNHDTDTRIAAFKNCKNVLNVGEIAKIINYDGYRLYVGHYPTVTGSYDDKALKGCLISLFGHTHQEGNFFSFDGRENPIMYHVGVDSHNCYPVKITDILKEITEKFYGEGLEEQKNVAL